MCLYVNVAIAALKLMNHLITERHNYKVPIIIYSDISKKVNSLNFDILLNNDNDNDNEISLFRHK